MEDGGFRANAPAWWSIAARILGWRPNEFWQATPREIIAAIQEPEQLGSTTAPSRELINKMLERDNNGH